MYPLPPSPEVGDACTDLAALLSSGIRADRFRSIINRLQRLFDNYAATCPSPHIAQGLIVTQELRIQSECYLPIADIAAAFTLLYSSALTYPPILSSTPFYSAMSWADTFVKLPPNLQFSSNPARLLEKLLADPDLLTEFLFYSFLPRRFYGGFGRYPEQRQYIRRWFETKRNRCLYCLDAACGTGEDTYALALLLSEEGLCPEQIAIEGWTLEPLEVWAATHQRFLHGTHLEMLYGSVDAAPGISGLRNRVIFRRRDILASPRAEGCAGARMFDLIFCNGLLGGPIINQKSLVERAVGNLAELLAPGGILLAADHFHGGWKQRCPQSALRASFEARGLICFAAGEGIGGLKPD